MNIPKEITSTNKQELEMVIFPDDFLRIELEPFTEEQVKTPLCRNTAGAMLRTMYKYCGIGLAAQQVGVPQAIFVMDHEWPVTGKRKPRIFINPEIVEAEGDPIELARPGEGCLSLPFGFRQPVARASRVLLKWRDLNWVEHEEWFEDTAAIVVQHEIDHLFGILFVDRMSRLKQDMFKRKMFKVRRQHKKGFKKALAAMKQAGKHPDPVKMAQNYELTKKGSPDDQS
jgi:peptide deformylase